MQDAAAVVPYVRALGADWLYLSPILQATRGSGHGYDVTDHRVVDEERGGPEGLRVLSEAARAAGLGILVDIVPNHVGVAKPVENPWWWDLLRNGRESEHAGAFDVDWAFGEGRVRLPVLGGTIEEAAAAGELRVEGEELRYFEHRFPLAPGSADDGADALTVHSRQHYELMNWRRADAELDYRRFFAVNELAAIRVEDDAVFDASHAEILRWLREGLADGLRVDHPDGLADPGGYLKRLAAVTDGAYVLVEKILEPGEELPAFWAADGTTGYDALAEIDGLLVDPAGEAPLTALDAELRERLGTPTGWQDLIHATKRGIADGILRSEVLRLVRDARPQLPPGADEARVADAMAELLAAFPVYRSYLPAGVEHLAHALAESRRRRPELGAELDLLAPILGDPATDAARRFQQTSGMVMAKGVEDTAFYRVSRLASRTEVGGDPDLFALAPSDFHAAQRRRLAASPDSMTTLSTHDTKRGEDTRARIHAISEIPDEWRAFVEGRMHAHPLGDGPLEHLVWQTIVGCRPREREALHGYVMKASREGGTSTTWTAPDEAFESRLHALVDACFDDPETVAALDAITARLRPAGWSNGLAAKLLQLAGPGVPDVYQGSELWERSLVDPDNRRSVDFAERAGILAALDAGELPELGEDAAAKLLVTSRVLRLRRDRPELFERYRPLPVVGEAAAHAVAVDRGGAIALATRLPIGLADGGGWRGTRVVLPGGRWRDALTGAVHEGGPAALAALLDRYPVALLVRDDDHRDETTEDAA
ncbi:malto-oligosyltrehalose synthase [Homoserinibacter sp. YIM 151385]|uniref:malto-oligosyltrehalose synthase n=1 Tax=Homoserinibacter sp. YIM 151385 TaxID=2985506 RepID=UPI0022F06ADE|nr:malto-oligosyltrehalose synthase [Homoserinibacter sp. YIM 151385]WBU39383.1 malto-oligosyltrehalose synthase [Homoserinibacter sp. YIM 151385]